MYLYGPGVNSGPAKGRWQLWYGGSPGTIRLTELGVADGAGGGTTRFTTAGTYSLMPLGPPTWRLPGLEHQPHRWHCSSSMVIREAQPPAGRLTVRLDPPAAELVRSMPSAATAFGRRKRQPLARLAEGVQHCLDTDLRAGGNPCTDGRSCMLAPRKARLHTSLPPAEATST